MTALAELSCEGSTVLLRRAQAQNLPAIVALLADDQLGTTRDGATDVEGLAPYLRAFSAIDSDPAQLLVVATVDANVDADVVGTLQLSFLPGLARRGALRGQIEAVRVHGSYRGRGLGAAMITWAIDEGRRRGCALMQLTTDKSLVDAHRFYLRLGFVASHEGLKRATTPVIAGSGSTASWSPP